MPKYKPEGKGKLERKVKEFDSKAKDRTKHMSSVVKNDAKAIADLSKKIRPGGTIEGAKAIKEAQQQAGGEVKKEYGHQKKSLEDMLKKGSKIGSEFKERGKDSKLNYAELTKTSNSIKETTAARNKINQGRQVARGDIYTLDSLRDTVYRAMQRAGQHIKEMDYRIASTLQLFGNGVNTEYMVQGLRVNQAAMEKDRNKNKTDPWEVNVVHRENQDHQLCARAKKEIGQANAAKEELEAKLKAGQLIQDGKQVQVASDISKKSNRNYGRSSVIPGDQNNLYKQKDTYE